MASLGGAKMNEMELISRYKQGQRNFARVNLRYSNLQRVDLHGVNFEEAMLSWSDLSGSNLSRANLRKADLRETDLSRADLRKANLCGVLFRKADLSGADLSGANLELADLRGASLAGSDLSGANLQGAQVTDKKLTEAKSLSGTIMPEGLIRFSDEGDPIVIRELEGAEREPGVKESGQAGTGSQQRSGCVFWHLERWPIAAATTAIVAAIPALFLLATFPLQAIAQRCPSWRPGSYFWGLRQLDTFCHSGGCDGGWTWRPHWLDWAVARGVDREPQLAYWVWMHGCLSLGHIECDGGLVPGNHHSHRALLSTLSAPWARKAAKGGNM
jgi:hypothetical protein